MNQTAILRPIGKGQITIPLAWRKALGIDRVAISARLEEGRIVLEPLPKEGLRYDVDLVSLNALDPVTRSEIEKSLASYRAGKPAEFVSHNDFWDV